MTPLGLHLQFEVLLLCTVAVASLRGQGLVRRPFSICDISCCQVLPSCRAALQVACNCTSQDSITLRKGDIPPSVRAVTISNAEMIVIHQDAINKLKRLANFSLQAIDQVEITEHGMAFDRPSKIRSVKFEDIRALLIKRNAFSGVWETQTSISISRVTEIRMESNAFVHRATTFGPSLTVENVRMLRLNTKTFTAPLYYVRLDDVAMDACLDQSFSGKIHSIAFKKVTINEAKARCFSNLDFLSTFFMDDSKINTVHPGAFAGHIRELSINTSNFTTIHERGIDIRTASMKISRSHIVHLSANGLAVTATDSLRLEGIRVNSLGGKALSGLKIQGGTYGFPQPLVIRDLDIEKAEEGSLEFADCAELQVSGLGLEAPQPPVCPTERWVRQLTGAAPSGQLTPAQFHVLTHLFEKRLCPEDVNVRFPTCRRSRHCGVAADNVHHDAAVESEAPGVHVRAEPPHKEVGERSSDAEEPAAEHAGNNRERKTDTSTRKEGGSNTAFGSETDEAVVIVNMYSMAATHRTDPPTGLTGPSAPRSDSLSGGELEPGRRPAARAADGEDVSTLWQHRPLLYLTLGAVVSLIIVVVLKVLWLARRHCDRPTNGQRLANERLATALADQLLGSGGHDGGRPPAEPAGSAPDSGAEHQYEQIGEDQVLRPPPFAAPPPPLPTQVTLQYEGPSAVSHLYEELLDRRATSENMD